MIKIAYLSICVLASSHMLWGQQLITGNNTKLYIGANSNLYAGMPAEFSGQLENLGNLTLAGISEFNQNQQVGDIVLTGNNATQISSASLSTLTLNSLTIQTTTPVVIEQLDSLIIDGDLFLRGRLVNTSGTRLEVNGNIQTNNDRLGFIEGQLAIQSSAGGEVNFPMGADGNYNALTLSAVPPASLINVVSGTDTPPNADLLRDSITAISTARWYVTFENNNDDNRFVIPTLSYTGQNLRSNVVNSINALNFAPVVALNTDGQYRSIGLQGEVPNNFNISAIITADGTTGNAIPMLEPTVPIEIAVGRVPTAEGLNLYVPTAFTPNGVLEENKVFRPYLIGADIAFMQFKVWDRYNRLIHNIEQELPVLEEIAWDGTMPNGTPATSGVYYYKVDIQVLGDVLSKSGTILLIR